MLKIGDLVGGKYKILDKIGQGGMSVVYLARNEKANHEWAVKEVRKDGVRDFEAVKQGLVAETNILKNLDHPNLPKIVDIIDADDTFIIVMDYVQGRSLDKVLNEAIQERRFLEQRDVIYWTKQLTDVFNYLHSRTPPIIYRDMKPANVMLKPDGQVALIDFGTAREFKEKNNDDTKCLGTLGYAAPEQFGGMGQTDGRTDIYNLGATMFHLLTGVNPGDHPFALPPIREINPSLSGGLERIVQKCTQREPKDRYQSAAELMYALEHFETYDDAYRKKQRRKLSAFIATSALTVAFGIGALAFNGLAEAETKNNYRLQLSKAQTIGEYCDTILIDPSRPEAYIGDGNDTKGLISLMTDDSVIDADEHNILSSMRVGLTQTDSRGYSQTVDVLGQLKSQNPSAYAEVCNEIGEAYLFYYDASIEKDKYSAAASWFQNTKDSNPVAKVYCDISECLQNITKFKNSSQFGKLNEEYKNLWQQLCSLVNNSSEYDDDLKVRIWREAVRMINNNAVEFNEISEKGEILGVLENIETESAKVDNAFLKDIVDQLAKELKTAKDKVSSIQKKA